VKTIKLSNASRPLTEYAAELGDDVLVLTERNRPVVAVVPLKGVDLESLALSSNTEFLELIARSRTEIQRGQTLTLSEMKKAFSADSSPIKRVRPTGTPRGIRRNRKPVPRRARG
jgi:antitoxin (DNA-binding transcriptional repressor) of toxin-antitoxin stability system